MQKEQNQIISQIRIEFEAVKEAYFRLKEEKDELVLNKRELIDRIEKQDIIIKELKTSNENLQLAMLVKGSTPDGESLASKRIDELVADIEHRRGAGHVQESILWAERQ